MVEMGARAPGTSPGLCARGPPDGGRGDRWWRPSTPRPFGTVEDVARAKARAGRGPAGRRHGRAQRRPTPGWRPWPRARRRRCVLLRRRAGDVVAEDVRPRRRAAARRSGCARRGATPTVRLAVRGAHQVDNALAAAAAAAGLRGAGRRGGRRAGATPCSSPVAHGARPHRPRAPSCSTTPTTPTRRRWRPPCGRWPRCRPAAGSPCSGTMAELGATSAGRHRRVAALAADARPPGGGGGRARLRRRAGAGRRRRARRPRARSARATPCW